MSVVIDGVRFHPPEGSPGVPSREPAERRANPAARSESSFERLLRGLGRQIEEGERAVRTAQNAYANLDAAELIALQAGIYRYGEAIDLASKLVDRATSGVRTVLQAGH
jgi:hypothetical protein